MDSTHSKYDERRYFIRMKVDTPVDVVVRIKGVSMRGICHDLSGGGMRVELDQKQPIGTELEVTVSPEHGHSPALKARAVVTRIEENRSDKEEEQPNSYTLGLAIEEILS